MAAKSNALAWKRVVRAIAPGRAEAHRFLEQGAVVGAALASISIFCAARTSPRLPQRALQSHRPSRLLGDVWLIAGAAAAPSPEVCQMLFSLPCV